jgi:molybdate transport system substrate-binding protein
MNSSRLVTIALAALLAVAVSAADLTVFAAASLSDALKEIAPAYSKITGDTVRFNFGASGTLVRQIKEGAPADLIVSADELGVDQLEKAGLLLPGTRRTILANKLVLIVAAENGVRITSLTDLRKADVRKIAMGEPATVPVGTYAKKYLEQLGLWTQVTRKCVPLDNVRAVLTAVESGDADAGFVYRTDAIISRKVHIAMLVPVADGPRITYPVAVVRDTRAPDAAKAFALFLAGPEAQKEFARFGFLPPN